MGRPPVLAVGGLWACFIGPGSRKARGAAFISFLPPKRERSAVRRYVSLAPLGGAACLAARALPGAPLVAFLLSGRSSGKPDRRACTSPRSRRAILPHRSSGPRPAI